MHFFTYIYIYIYIYIYVYIIHHIQVPWLPPLLEKHWAHCFKLTVDWLSNRCDCVYIYIYIYIYILFIYWIICIFIYLCACIYRYIWMYMSSLLQAHSRLTFKQGGRDMVAMYHTIVGSMSDNTEEIYVLVYLYESVYIKLTCTYIYTYIGWKRYGGDVSYYRGKHAW
jgi:hypothetical protein